MQGARKINPIVPVWGVGVLLVAGYFYMDMKLDLNFWGPLLGVL